MRRTCGDRSLSTITRHTTWLGDVTYRPDDVPWGDPTHADPTVDADLELMCKRLMQHYRSELEDAMARREPWTACRALGCEDVDASVLDAIAHDRAAHLEAVAGAQDGTRDVGGFRLAVALAADVLPAEGPREDSDEARGGGEDDRARAGERGAGSHQRAEGGVVGRRCSVDT